MQMEAGDTLQHGRVPDVHGHVGKLLEDVLQLGQPLLGEEERSRRVSGRNGTSHHLGTLGDVKSLGGFGAAAQLGVGEAAVIGKPGVRGALQPDSRHQLGFAMRFR